MTNREYIEKKLAAFNITDADYADMGGLVYLDDTFDGSPDFWKGFVGIIEGLILAPRVKSVNENGFSMSWDTDSLGKWYMWLCRKHSIKPDDDVLALLGLSAIIDISDQW